jgi:predicted dehydrogenase
MDPVLRIGVIGLGPRWRRYRRALRALRRRFVVTAVCDAVHDRAVEQARRLRCRVAAGPTHLLESNDVDAALLCDPGWLGLWPLERAAALGKPVLCAIPLDADPDHADSACQAVEAAGLFVMPAQPVGLAPLLGRLRDLVRDRLGAVRVVSAEVVQPAGQPDEGAAGMMAACLSLFESPPAVEQVDRREMPGLTTLTARLAEGRMVHLTHLGTPSGRASVRLRVVAQRGTATADLPRRLSWEEADARHTLVLARGYFSEADRLARFFAALTTSAAADAGWAEAVQAWQIVRPGAGSNHPIPPPTSHSN